jgi:acetyl-CoA carboxylase carboxyl transferase subunit beta
MALERWFRRKRPTRGEDDASPIGLWLKCAGCQAQIYRKDLIANLYVCPECSHHERMPVDARVALLSDEDTFERWSGRVAPTDALGFVDTEPYAARLESVQQKTERSDAVVTGGAQLDGLPVALAVMDFAFLGGSMGSVVGEEIARAAERAADEGRALITVSASGGARMQEGAFSLMQMAKTTVALEALADRRLPFLSVLTDPTTGGVTASFATLGDLVVAEPGALICFAGPRVIQQTIKQDLPEGFQRSEFLLRKGMLDDVIPRAALKARLATFVRLLRAGLDARRAHISVSTLLAAREEDSVSAEAGDDAVAEGRDAAVADLRDAARAEGRDDATERGGAEASDVGDELAPGLDASPRDPRERRRGRRAREREPAVGVAEAPDTDEQGTQDGETEDQEVAERAPSV